MSAFLCMCEPGVPRLLWWGRTKLSFEALEPKSLWRRDRGGEISLFSLEEAQPLPPSPQAVEAFAQKSIAWCFHRGPPGSLRIHSDGPPDYNPIYGTEGHGMMMGEAELLDKAVLKLEGVVKLQLAQILAEAGQRRDLQRLHEMHRVWKHWAEEEAGAAHGLGQPVKFVIDSEGQARPIRVDLPSELGSEDSCT